MVWIHAINESAAAEFAEDVLNPLHPDKFRVLGRRIRLQPGQRVLDIGAGRCGPALVLAREFGCNVTAVEPYEEFFDAGRARVEAAGLTAQFEFVQSTGADFTLEPEHYDVAMCIGATWAYGDLDGTLKALGPAVRSGGHVVCGEGWRTPDQTAQGWQGTATLADVLQTFEDNDLPVVTLIRSTIDDFDQYHSVQATSLLDWLDANPGHEDASDVREWRRGPVEDFALIPFGWGVIAGRKP